MTKYFEAGIASVQAYQQALLAMQVESDAHLVPGLDLLRSLHRQPGHTATAGELASLLGLGSYGAANLRVGKFAHALADRLSYMPPKRKNGTPMWWSTIATGEHAKPDTPFTFTLRPELQAALQNLGWLADNK